MCSQLRDQLFNGEVIAHKAGALALAGTLVNPGCAAQLQCQGYHIHCIPSMLISPVQHLESSGLSSTSLLGAPSVPPRVAPPPQRTLPKPVIDRLCMLVKWPRAQDEAHAGAAAAEHSGRRRTRFSLPYLHVAIVLLQREGSAAHWKQRCTAHTPQGERRPAAVGRSRVTPPPPAPRTPWPASSRAPPWRGCRDSSRTQGNA